MAGGHVCSLFVSIRHTCVMRFVGVWGCAVTVALIRSSQHDYLLFLHTAALFQRRVAPEESLGVGEWLPNRQFG
jgi:hypothetical protein